MKFCEYCQRVLVRYIETGEVIFKCSCGRETIGDTSDSLISEEYSTNDNSAKYDIFIKNAAFDQVNLIVMRECKSCKKDHMKMIRLGDKVVLYVCDCGNIE